MTATIERETIEPEHTDTAPELPFADTRRGGPQGRHSRQDRRERQRSIPGQPSARHRATRQARRAAAPDPFSRRVLAVAIGVSLVLLASGVSTGAKHAAVAPTTPQLVPAIRADQSKPAVTWSFTDGGRNIADQMRRNVSKGLGNAKTGGAYRARPAGRFRVDGRHAVVAALRPGHAATATLTGVHALNEKASLAFRLPQLPTSGRGTYVEVALRKQANGDEYSFRARVAPGGVVVLNIAQLSGGAARAVGPSFTLPQPLAAGQTLILQAFVGQEGDDAALRARAWVAGGAAPAWQIAQLQSTDILAKAGAAALSTYTSVSSAGQAVQLLGFFGNYLVPVRHLAGLPPQPLPEPTPTSTPSSATPPSSPTPSSHEPPSPTAPKSTSPAPSSPSSSTPRPSGGQPGSSNTGVPAGTTLKDYDGNLVANKAGATYSGLDIHGFVKVTAPNVTIKNSIIRGGVATGDTGLVKNESNSATNLLVEDSELVPAHPSVYIDGIRGWNYTALRLDIHGTVDGAKVYGPNVRIQDTYIHDTAAYSHDADQNGGPTHNDGVQVLGGNNVVIEHNTIIGGTNSALQVTQSHGNANGLVFSDNWLSGGACTINVAVKPLKAMSGLQLNGNRFTNTSTKDCPMIINSTVTYAANNDSFLDGSPVRIRRN